MPSPASDPIQAALDFVSICETLGLRYAVVGSFASVAHGVPRTTLDADILLEIDTRRIIEFIDALKPRFFVDPVEVTDGVALHGSFNLLHRTSLFRIDVFVVANEPFNQLQIQRANPMPLTSTARSAFVATREDTILAKLRWYKQSEGQSQRQWSDAIGILQIHHDELNWEYMNAQAHALDISDLLAQARQQSQS